MRPLTRKLLRSLWQLRWQVLTIALVVACGVGGFLGSLSAHQSLLRLRDTFYEEARFGHVFAQARRAPLTVLRSIAQLPGVIDVGDGIAGAATVNLASTVEVMSALVLSLPVSPASGVNRVYVKHGRWVELGDRDGVLLSDAFATARGIKPGDSLRLLLNGRHETVSVTGIAVSPPYLFAASQGGFSDDRSFAVIWMPRQRLAAAYDLVGAFNDVVLRLSRDANPRRIIGSIDAILEPYGTTGAYDRAQQLSNRVLSQEINEQKVFGTVLPTVVMAVAVFLLQMLLARHIATERLQIASLKALGYGDSHIGLHYLQFVAVIVLLGAAGGIAIGYFFGRWLTGMYTQFFRFPEAGYWLDAGLVLAACLLTLGVALLSAWSAVRKVMQLPPAEAMRPPAPLAFGASFVDRWASLRRLPVVGKMLLREIARRPGRAAGTTVGAASGVAIVLAGIWFGDAFDRIIEVEMFRRDRADVLLALTRPEERSVLHAIARLPGVTAAEGARMVPARIENGRHSYRTAVTGLDFDAQLRPVLDEQLGRLPVPANGIVLTDRLAGVLNVSVGMSVRVQSLEGRRLVFQLPVVALSGDMMGMQAYVSRRLLTRATGEGDFVNLVRVRLDANSRPEFFARLRESPLIAASGDKARMIAHFRSTSARNLIVLAALIAFFASCVTFGVVFNSARIALAERAWELATLRVIGLTRAEVSAILLGQFALQLLVALPLGCVAGYGLSWTIIHLIEAEEFRVPIVLNPDSYLIAIAITVTAAAASAAFVRRQIDQLDLIAVLKTPT